jgi:AmmeMemoRadiSam system protein A
VAVDLELANQLIAANKVFEFHSEAHAQEHCLEVQIPFLQYHLKTDFNIVPIVVATQSEITIKKISEALKPFFTADNLFVISSDFSHYPGYEDAKTVDKITAGAIASNSPDQFLAAIASNEAKGYKGLSTAMCGWPAMLTLLNITTEVSDIEISLLDYKNSGDAVYGDHDRVVGYWAIAFHQTEAKPDHGFMLTDEDQAALLKIARNAIINAVGNKPEVKFNPDDFSDTLLSRLGVFVSVYVDDELRGCIGRFDPESPLYESVGELAVSSATEDSRFRPVIEDDLDLLSIELSVLTPLKKVDTIDEIEPGRHGIFLKKGFHSGTFLPQVATKNNWNVEEFLGHCARDKAKIGWDGWKNAEIYTYEAIVFGDK